MNASEIFHGIYGDMQITLTLSRVLLSSIDFLGSRSPPVKKGEDLKVYPTLDSLYQMKGNENISSLVSLAQISSWFLVFFLSFQYILQGRRG